MDYCDINFNQGFNGSFHQEIEAVQYNVALTVTGTIRETSKKKLWPKTVLWVFEVQKVVP